MYPKQRKSNLKALMLQTIARKHIGPTFTPALSDEHGFPTAIFTGKRHIVRWLHRRELRISLELICTGKPSESLGTDHCSE